MDLVRLANPAWLWLLVPVWAALWLPVFRRRGLRSGDRLRTGLATAASGLLVLALAGPSVRVGRADGSAVVLAVDASGSMTAAWSRSRLDRWLRPWRTALAPWTSREVSFGGPLDTDIAAGLRAAAAVLPASASAGTPRGLVLLFTDGRDTGSPSGAVSEAARLASAGVMVHAVRPPPPPTDAAVVSVEVPPAPPAHRPVTFIVRIAASRETTAQVTLQRRPTGGLPAREWTRLVRLAPGAPATLLFRDGPLPRGRFSYALALHAEADACEANNTARWTLLVGDLRRVTYVFDRAETGTAEAPPLLAALKRLAPAGVVVEGFPTDGEPVPVDVSLVLLDNLPAWRLGRDAAARLARAVEAGGMGLWVLGGNAAFSAGGYADSPLEAILPVSSRTTARRPVDLVVVLDTSGSMNEAAAASPDGAVAGQKLALAKLAVLALRPALAPADRLAVVAFAGRPRLVQPLASPAEWETLRRRLGALAAGGGTRITPSLEAALGLLETPPGKEATDSPAESATPGAAAPTRLRHILLLSDGRSEDFDVARLAALARQKGASVSCVATGPEARRRPLARLAEATGGRFYAEVRPARLAETFLEDLARTRGEGLRRGPLPARWRNPSPVWSRAGAALPPVTAVNPTVARPEAEVHWTTEPAPDGPRDGWPLLATWQRGLGRVAAMPWPAGKAAPTWFAGAAGAARLRPLLEWLAQTARPTTWTARLTRTASRTTPPSSAIPRWTVQVKEEPTTGDPGRPFLATVLPARGEAAETTLAAVRPGEYEAALPPSTGAGAVVIVRRKGEAARLRLAVPEVPPTELARLGPDPGQIEAVVRAGAGRVHERPETLLETLRRLRAQGYRRVDWLLVVGAAGVVAVAAVLRLAGRV